MANGRGNDRSRRGHVYFIRCEANGLIKIGFTAGRPEKRFCQHRTSSPVELHPLALMPGIEETERALHARFRDDWSHGEWFRPSEALIAYISDSAKPWYHPLQPWTDPRNTRFKRQLVVLPPNPHV